MVPPARCSSSPRQKNSQLPCGRSCVANPTLRLVLPATPWISCFDRPQFIQQRNVFRPGGVKFFNSSQRATP